MKSESLRAGLVIEHKQTGQRATVTRVNKAAQSAVVRMDTTPPSRASGMPFSRLFRDWREATDQTTGLLAATGIRPIDLSAFFVQSPDPPLTMFMRFLHERTTDDVDAADHGPYVVGGKVVFRADHWIEWLAEQGVHGSKVELTAPLHTILPGLQRRSVKLSTGRFASALTATVPAGLDLPVRGRLHGGGFKAPDAPSREIGRLTDLLVERIQETFIGTTPDERKYVKSRITRLLRTID